MIRYLRLEEIADVNRKFILQTGGFLAGAGRLINPNSLKYLIEIVQAKLGGEEVYPSLAEKAALYAFQIIRRHVFFDGNKRTGLACVFMFLRLNGCNLSESISENEIVDLALGVANREIDLPELTVWIQQRLH